jgi:hypothetical protein
VATGAVLLGRLPDWVWQVPYVGAAFPGAVARQSWRTGANCQLFAYEVLALNGWDVPDLRSDELWLDTDSTACVGEPQPLDLVLFQKDEQLYGAHVGVVVDDDHVLHLCKEAGMPAVWPRAQFTAHPGYRVVIGFKRPTRRLDSRRA